MKNKTFSRYQKYMHIFPARLCAFFFRFGRPLFASDAINGSSAHRFIVAGAVRLARRRKGKVFLEIVARIGQKTMPITKEKETFLLNRFCHSNLFYNCDPSWASRAPALGGWVSRVRSARSHSA